MVKSHLFSLKNINHVSCISQQIFLVFVIFARYEKGGKSIYIIMYYIYIVFLKECAVQLVN